VPAVVYAFAVSLQAWRTAATEIERRRARAFVIGFVIRDISWSATYGYLTLLWLGQVQPMPNLLLIYSIGTLVEVPLIVYGILSAQLCIGTMALRCYLDLHLHKHLESRST